MELIVKRFGGLFLKGELQAEDLQVRAKDIEQWFPGWGLVMLQLKDHDFFPLKGQGKAAV